MPPSVQMTFYWHKINFTYYTSKLFYHANFDITAYELANLCRNFFHSFVVTNPFCACIGDFCMDIQSRMSIWLLEMLICFNYLFNAHQKCTRMVYRIRLLRLIAVMVTLNIYLHDWFTWQIPPHVSQLVDAWAMGIMLNLLLQRNG